MRTHTRLKKSMRMMNCTASFYPTTIQTYRNQILMLLSVQALICVVQYASIWQLGCLGKNTILK